MMQLSLFDLEEAIADADQPVPIAPAVEPTESVTNWPKAKIEAHGLDGLADAWVSDELADLQAARARFVAVLRQGLAKVQQMRAETQAEIDAHKAQVEAEKLAAKAPKPPRQPAEVTAEHAPVTRWDLAPGFERDQLPALILGALADGPLTRDELRAHCPSKPGAVTMDAESLWTQGLIDIEADGLCRIAEQPAADLTLAGEPAVVAPAPDVCSEQTLEPTPSAWIGADTAERETLPACLYDRCDGRYWPYGGKLGIWGCDTVPFHRAWIHQPGILGYHARCGEATYIQLPPWASDVTPAAEPAEQLPAPAEITPPEPGYAPLYALPPGMGCLVCQAELEPATDRPDVWYCQADRRHLIWACGYGGGVVMDHSDGDSWAIRLPAPAWVERARAYAAELEREKAEKAAATELKKAAKGAVLAA